MIENRRQTAVILAAGDGKRMKSDRPKVLCEVLFKPMLCWVEDACRAAGIEEVYIVAGAQEELLKQAASPRCHFVCQSERRGTGHAAMMAAQAFAADGDVLILHGDAPFISAQVIQDAYAQHREQQNALTLISAELDNPTGYGRIVRKDGAVCAIVEQKDASDEQKAIREINSGAYWFDAAFLRQALGLLTADNAQGEYYLTDTVAIAVAQKQAVDGYCCPDRMVTLGANDRAQLLELNEIARRMVLAKHLENGVDLLCTDGILIGPEVEIAHDARILPGCILKGRTTIGAHAVIGPNSYLENATVGAYSEIKASYLTDSTVGEHATVGPFTQLRPNSHLGNGVKVGDFVEIKNSTIGAETSIAHLTYIGDSDVGSQCNFGCGVVTANYDGKKKYRTTIGDRAFIGCNTNIISPVQIGEGAYTAAGTTVDSDVPAGALSIGRVRQQIKQGWSDSNISFKRRI